MSNDLYTRAALAMGWIHSPAHDGYINERHREDHPGSSAYVVAEDPTQACFLDGIGDDETACRVVEKTPGRHGEPAPTYMTEKPNAI